MRDFYSYLIHAAETKNIYQAWNTDQLNSGMFRLFATMFRVQTFAVFFPATVRKLEFTSLACATTITTVECATAVVVVHIAVAVTFVVGFSTVTGTFF